MLSQGKSRFLSYFLEAGLKIFPQKLWKRWCNHTIIYLFTMLRVCPIFSNTLLLLASFWNPDCVCVKWQALYALMIFTPLIGQNSTQTKPHLSANPGVSGKGGQGGLVDPLASDCKWHRTVILHEKRREKGKKKENGQTSPKAVSMVSMVSMV